MEGRGNYFKMIGRVCLINGIDFVTGYNYGSYFEDALLDEGFTQEDVNKIKIWNSGYPKEPDNGACTISKVYIVR